jgi:hypothetical protein
MFYSNILAVKMLRQAFKISICALTMNGANESHLQLNKSKNVTWKELSSDQISPINSNQLHISTTKNITYQWETHGCNPHLCSNLQGKAAKESKESNLGTDTLYFFLPKRYTLSGIP